MEDNLKRLVCEVTRLNREAGFEVDPNVIAYAACLQEIQKAWDDVTAGASLANGAFEPALIAAIGQLLHDELKRPDSPFLATAKMQVMMEVEFNRQRAAIEQEQAEHKEQADMLSRSICATPSTRSTTVQAYEKLHKLIFEYVCVQSRLDRALADEAAGDEVRAAVASVFPLSSLARFLTLNEEERLHQIVELARIVLGICLYNRQMGTGANALPPVTQTYLPQAQRLLRDLARHASSVCADLASIRTLQTGTDADGVSVEDAAAARARAGLEAVNLAQAFGNFQQLSADLAAGLEAARQLEDEVQHVLLEVTETIGSSAAVQKEVIYPLFDRVGSLHTSLQEEQRLLVVRQRLYEEAVAMLGGYVSMLPPKVETRPGRPKPKSSSPWASKLVASPVEEHAEQELAESSLQEVPALPEGLEYIAAPVCGSQEQEMQVLQGVSLTGFCPVSLVKHGVLAVAKPSLGFIKVSASGQVFGFASASALKAFASGQFGTGEQVLAEVDNDKIDHAPHFYQMMSTPGPPKQPEILNAPQVFGFASASALKGFASGQLGTGEQVLAEVDKAVLKQPLLAKLAGRGAELHPALNLQAVVGIMSGPLKVDFGCQTPVHFLERHIDYSYEWNEWALRRRALALANLRQKRTHSTQTALTHFKRDGDTQVWLPKEAVVQTRVDKGQAMPKKLQYVAGLRGAPNTKMNVIRLELDLGQPHQY